MRILLALFAALLLLSVGPGATASTSTPPRNGLIAVSGSEGIAIVDPVAGTTKLIPKSAELSDPTWSPDGTTLAVSAVSAPSGEGSAVYTVQPDGTERTLVLKNAYMPSWSPDGKELVAVREGWESNRLVVVSADGTDERVLEPAGLPAEAYVSAPAWSPDGSRIAFVAPGEGRVYLTTPDGEKLQAIEVEYANDVSWSPDSSRLAIDRYLESKDGSRQVVAIHDLATGKETLLEGKQDGAQAATWSPEGDRLAFLSTSKPAASTTTTGSSTTTTHSCGGDSSPWHLWVMAPDGSKAQQLAKGDFYGTPSWGRAAETSSVSAPVTGQKPAPAPVAQPEPAPVADPPASTAEPPSKSAETARPTPAPEQEAAPPSTKGLIAVRGSNAIYLVDPGTAAAHKVPQTADMIAPSWAPERNLLAVERVTKEGASSIYVVTPDGAKAQFVLENASAPSWTPAGDRILAVRNECSTPCEPEDDEANVLYSVRPDGSDLQRVDAEQSDLYASRELAWRIDGSPISFFDDESANTPGSFDTVAAAWSPDESQIAFVGALTATEDEAAEETGTAGLWIVSADGGTPQLLLEGASGLPSWSQTALGSRR